MAFSHFRAKRKASGGRYKRARSHPISEHGSEPMFTRIEEKRVKTVDGPGSTTKRKAFSLKDVTITKDGKAVTTQMLSVLENPANRNYVRRNIITKGTLVETPEGKVRITNRPSQEGNALGVLE
ncbi:MAG: 30S ribosomal protein S8e [Candidatus Woesearchaeota archaeon]